jgi:predicted enzyme related to lactoylglutathione lyase
MRRITLWLMGALGLASGLAQAASGLNGVRIGAPDVLALEKFYQSLFGLKEIMRVNIAGMPEVILGFGDSAEAARANPGDRVVIAHRDAGTPDPMAHVILNVSDVAASVAAVKAAGGALEQAPHTIGGGHGPSIAIVIDPAGNRIELIQPPSS